MKLITRITMFLFLSIVTYLLVKHYLELKKAPDLLLKDLELNQPSQIAPFSREMDRKDGVDDIAVTEIVVAVVTCGDRLSETLVMLKSAILFSPPSHLRIVIITEPNLMASFEAKLSEWRKVTNESFVFEIHKVSFPEAEGNEWKTLFKPCAAERLFLPSILSHLDAILYVDTDVLFLAPLSLTWTQFSRMNSTQLAALTPEHEEPNFGWYNRFARHPYYGKLGVNSGVMLMNLTKMREFKWESYLLPILNEFKLKITWGDQDIINIIFHYHPERLLIYDCRYNYRSDHCIYMSVCKEAENSGVRVIHGSRGTFHSEKLPSFKAIFNTMEQYTLGTDPHHNLVLPLRRQLYQTTDTICDRISHIFTKEMKQYFSQAGKSR